MCQGLGKVLSVVVVALTVNSVLCIPYKNSLRNVLDFGGSKVDNCVMEGNLTCLELIVRSQVHDFLHSNEYRLSDNVVIEKMPESSSGRLKNRVKNLLYSRKQKQNEFIRKVRNLIGNRSLRVDFLDTFRLRMSQAPSFPEEVELSFELVPEESTKVNGQGGKGHRTAKIVVPLVIGFIITGLGILAISTIKAILMKAFFVSTLAALTGAFLVIKKALANAHKPEAHPYYFAQYPIPYETAYHAPDIPSFDTAHFNALNHYATIQPSDWSAQYLGLGSNGYAVTEHESGSSGATDVTDSDSHGQFSNMHTAMVQSSSKMKRKLGAASPSRGPIKLVKSLANRVPVLAYRHTGTGRKLS